MFDDELPKKPSYTLDLNLEPLSLDELAVYIKALEDEIERTKGEVVRKKTHMESAASIFK